MNFLKAIEIYSIIFKITLKYLKKMFSVLNVLKQELIKDDCKLFKFLSQKRNT